MSEQGTLGVFTCVNPACRAILGHHADHGPTGLDRNPNSTADAWQDDAWAITLCAHCGTLMAVRGDHEPRALTDAEQAEVEATDAYRLLTATRQRFLAQSNSRWN